jgi:hypothetical protein
VPSLATHHLFLSFLELPLTRDLADNSHTVRYQVRRQLPLFEKRHKLTSEIRGFWPLVMEQAPPDIDEYIQPSDSNLLVTALTSLYVTHFEAEDGDPRSVAIRFEFDENEYFEDRVIEKKFWHRTSKDGWTGFVSEPVDIKWKEGKDLTEGLLGLAKALWDEDQAAGANGAGSKAKELTPKQKELKDKIEAIGLGGVSFFAWFGYRGPKVSAEESKLATKEEKERRERRAAGEEVSTPKNDDDEEEDDEEEFEIFPSGDQLALAIAEDLWPSAIKYFSKSLPFGRTMNPMLTSAADQAQEDDALSDASFEDFDDEAGLSQVDSDEDERPSKKRKA